MTLDQILSAFVGEATQCDKLIADAHQKDASGTMVFPPTDRAQITVAALLNLYIAWEIFLESSLLEFMVGSATRSGRVPVRFVCPVSAESAQSIVIGCNWSGHFDYGNRDYVRTIVNSYFEDGYPFEPCLDGISSELGDLKIMRNASAHRSITTQRPLEIVAKRIFGVPRPNIDLYALLINMDPRSTPGNTVYTTYRDKLLVTAELILNG